ncbi:hypothetical protein [Actinoplanes sp. NPDC023714]
MSSLSDTEIDALVAEAVVVPVVVRKVDLRSSGIEAYQWWAVGR